MWSPTDVEPVTAMDATDIQGSSKRTADTAGLNEDGEVVHRLEKARRPGQCAGTSPLRVRLMTIERRDRDRQDRCYR